MATTLTSDGRLTIPKLMRERLGLGPGSVVEFELTDDGQGILVRPRPERFVDRLERLRGCATAGLSTDEIMALTRGED